MPSTATGYRTVEQTPATETKPRVDVIEVVVAHRDSDSFTRSVDPTATRFVTSGKAGRYSQAAKIDGSRYAEEEQFAARDTRPWCISFIRFEVTR